MPTTTAVFKFTPGDVIHHPPEHLDILNTFNVFITHKITTTNVLSHTIDTETSTRTVVREWASHEIATEFVTELQRHTSNGFLTWPGQLISVQVNT